MSDLSLDPAVFTAAPPFAAFPERARRSLLYAGRRHAYAPRESIARAGEPCDGVYVLLSGSVRVVVQDADGHQATLAVLRAGDFFGDVEMIDGQPHGATADAIKACDILFVPRHAFMALLGSDPEAALLLLAAFARRLRGAYTKIASLALRGVRARVGQALLDCCEPVNGVWLVQTGSEELARMVGASREMVSRVLRAMREEGLIRRVRRKTILLDRTRLLD